MKYFPTSIAFTIQNFRPNQTKTFELPRLKRGRIDVVITEIIIKKPRKPDAENPGSLSTVNPARGVSAKVINGAVLIVQGDDTFSIQNNIEGGGFELVVKNNNKLRKKVTIAVRYVSDRQILEKKIPLAFFKQAFDTFWNRVQPIKEVRLDNNILAIIWDEALQEALGLPTITHDIGGIPIKVDFTLEYSPFDVFPDTNALIRDLKTTNIQFAVSSKKYGRQTLPVFTVRVLFEDEGVNEISLFDVNYPNVDVKSFSIKVDFHIEAYKNKLRLGLLPKVYSQIDVAVFPDGLIDDEIDKKIEETITQEIGKYLPAYGPKITKWFLGDAFDIHSLKVKEDIIIIEYAEPIRNQAGSDIDSIGDSPGTQPVAAPGAAGTPTSHGPANISTVGRLREIDHFVVLMMENRSFDQVLGYLSLAGREGNSLPNAGVNGLKESEYDNWANEYNGQRFMPYKLEDPHIMQSPNHGYLSVKDQKAYNMKGFVTDFANIEGNPDEPKVVMGYYDAAQLEVYGQLANEFLVCDRWYCAFPGGTWPNRFITLSGHLQTKPDGSANYDNPSLSEFYPIQNKNLFDILTNKGVSWKYFEHGYCFLRLYSKYTYDMENIINARDEEKGFFELARRGELPSVSFIDPDFIEYPPGNDDHAPAHPHCGQKLVGEIVNALMVNEDAWKKTMLIITYDEHGGFYDHVNPEQDEPAPAISGTLKEYGIRVPTIIVSPWVKKGDFTNRLMDHTSIAATILRRFCSPVKPDMGPRINTANDLEHVIEDTVRENIPNIQIPDYPECDVFSLRTPRTAPTINGKKSEDEFHELLLMASMFGRSPK